MRHLEATSVLLMVEEEAEDSGEAEDSDEAEDDERRGEGWESEDEGG
jgi:hypothetical protein